MTVVERIAAALEVACGALLDWRQCDVQSVAADTGIILLSLPGFMAG